MFSGSGLYTQLPSEVNILAAAIPSGAMTPVTTVDTEVAQITVSNTSGGAITITIEDTQASPIAFQTNKSVPANDEVTYQFSPPLLFKGGLQWQAGGSGLVGTVRGRKLLNKTLGTNNAPV